MLLEGQFGKIIQEIEEDPIEFNFCGKTFTASENLYGFAYMRFQYQMKKSNGAKTAAEDNEAIYDFFRGIFDADETWQEFQELILVNRVPISELFRLTRAISEAMAARPTEASSLSSAGRSKTTTGPKSKKRSSRASSQKTVSVAELPGVTVVESEVGGKPENEEIDFGEPVSEKTANKLRAIG